MHKIRLEIYTADSQAQEIISTILKHCASGKMGDGKIAVLQMDDCTRVRTGERKNRAIT